MPEAVSFLFTPLESPAIYGGDDKNKASIPYRKGGVKVLPFLTGFRFTEVSGGSMAESPRNNSYSCLLRIDVATWEGAHFYHLPLLYLVNTYLINTFDFPRTIGQRCTTYSTGVKVFNLVETIIQYVNRL